MDVFARDNDLVIDDLGKAASFSADLLREKSARVIVPDKYDGLIAISGEAPGELQVEYSSEVHQGGNTVLISPDLADSEGLLQLVPKCVVLGIGCRKGKSFEQLRDFAAEALQELGRTLPIGKPRVTIAGIGPGAGDLLTGRVRKVLEDCDALIFTGDIADSPSRANLELLESMLEGRRYLYTFGNHDYYSYDSDCGCAEDRDLFLDEFLRFLPCDPTMDAMQIGGVNFVALDDSLAQFSWLQLDFLKAEIKKGLPILLFLHLPIYSPTFVPKAYEWWDSSMCVGTPADVLAAHGETDPKMPADEATLAMLELIRTEPLIKAIFASHLHFADESVVLGKPQFVNEPCYLGSVREIVLR